MKIYRGLIKKIDLAVKISGKAYGCACEPRRRAQLTNACNCVHQYRNSCLNATKDVYLFVPRLVKTKRPVALTVQPVVGIGPVPPTRLSTTVCMNPIFKADSTFIFCAREPPTAFSNARAHAQTNLIMSHMTSIESCCSRGRD